MPLLTELGFFLLADYKDTALNGAYKTHPLPSAISAWFGGGCGVFFRAIPDAGSKL